MLWKIFCTENKKETLYCDRMLTNGKTCKQWATVLKSKIQVLKFSKDTTTQPLQPLFKTNAEYEEFKTTNTV